MLVLKLPLAIFGCSDCDIVNFCFPFVDGRAAHHWVDFQGQNGKTRIGRMKRGGSLLNCWYGAVCTVGLGFGLLGERRPFGQNILAHPFIVYAFLVAAGLLVLRVVWQRPVPELIPERALGLGCAAGVALFLAGNFIAAHVVGR
jgi:hypothetical protein